MTHKGRFNYRQSSRQITHNKIYSSIQQLHFNGPTETKQTEYTICPITSSLISLCFLIITPCAINFQQEKQLPHSKCNECLQIKNSDIQSCRHVHQFSGQCVSHILNTSRIQAQDIQKVIIAKSNMTIWINTQSIKLQPTKMQSSS